MSEQEQEHGPLRFRSAQLQEVSFPKRIIELVVTPYERASPVPWDDGRIVEEIFSRGCYDGIEKRANRVRANRDHDTKRTVGRALSFHPSNDYGLVAAVKIARTELGDETLELAADDCLDASAGYAPLGRDGEVWETRQRVRIRKAFLGHIALTPEPAHEGARVLTVRHKAEPELARERIPTPNLDQVRAMLLEDRWRRLDAGRSS